MAKYHLFLSLSRTFYSRIKAIRAVLELKQAEVSTRCRLPA